MERPSSEGERGEELYGNARILSFSWQIVEELYKLTTHLSHHKIEEQLSATWPGGGS
jgi:hypothetical protein